MYIHGVCLTASVTSNVVKLPLQKLAYVAEITGIRVRPTSGWRVGAVLVSSMLYGAVRLASIHRT